MSLLHLTKQESLATPVMLAFRMPVIIHFQTPGAFTAHVLVVRIIEVCIGASSTPNQANSHTGETI